MFDVLALCRLLLDLLQREFHNREVKYQRLKDNMMKVVTKGQAGCYYYYVFCICCNVFYQNSGRCKDLRTAICLNNVVGGW